MAVATANFFIKLGPYCSFTQCKAPITTIKCNKENLQFFLTVNLNIRKVVGFHSRYWQPEVFLLIRCTGHWPFSNCIHRNPSGKSRKPDYRHLWCKGLCHTRLQMKLSLNLEFNFFTTFKLKNLFMDSDVNIYLWQYLRLTSLPL